GKNFTTNFKILFIYLLHFSNTKGPFSELGGRNFCTMSTELGYIMPKLLLLLIKIENNIANRIIICFLIFGTLAGLVFHGNPKFNFLSLKKFHSIRYNKNQ